LTQLKQHNNTRLEPKQTINHNLNDLSGWHGRCSKLFELR